jgi:hypothetical protein
MKSMTAVDQLRADLTMALIEILRLHADQVSIDDLRGFLALPVGIDLKSLPVSKLFGDHGRVPRRNSKLQISASDLSVLRDHLMPEEPRGAGATVVTKLSEGILGLIKQGVGEQTLGTSATLRLITGKTGISIWCCVKTASRALRAIAKRSPLVKQRGKRWHLRLSDAELLVSIIRGDYC